MIFSALLVGKGYGDNRDSSNLALGCALVFTEKKLSNENVILSWHLNTLMPLTSCPLLNLTVWKLYYHYIFHETGTQ